jgi:hypothetical protein
MPDILNEHISQWLSIADKRNLALENPITLKIDIGGGELYYVAVSHVEPNHVTLPINVTWVVADPASPDYMKALRRVSALPSGGYRNTWAQLQSYQDFLDESQFWDLSAAFQLGEVEISAVGVATTEVRGLFELNRVSEDPSDPAVVGGNDTRMSDARQPLPHSHPDLPSSMVFGASGINAYYVKIDDGLSPLPGQVLMLTDQGATPNEFNGVWRNVVAADLNYDGATFDNLVINSASGNSVNETDPVVFTADALFSDTSTLTNVAAEWSIISGATSGYIGSSTGVLNTNDVVGDQVIRIQASFTHADSGVTRNSTFDINVVDTTSVATLVSIAIAGAATVNEGANTENYVVTATYSDTSTAGVVPTLFTSSNPAAGSLDAGTGVFTSTSNASSNQLTTLSASYTEGGVTQSTTLDITTIDTTVYPVSAQINGLNTVGEGQTTPYVMVVSFSDSSSSQVVVTDWAVDNAAAGAIVATSGVFTAVPTLTSNESAELSASYTSNGVTINATKSIVASDTTVYPVSAAVTGSAAVQEGTSNTYQLSVTFSDSSVAVVSVIDWSVGNVAAGSIVSNTGVFTANQLSANENTTISSSYTSEGVTVSDSITVLVSDETNYPVSALVIGAATMNENASQTLTLQVTYQDTSTANVTATSWVSSNTSAATIDAAGLVIAATNLLTSASSTFTGSYTENGVTVTDTLDVSVVDNTNYPVSAVILGLVSVSESSSASYQLQVTWQDTSTTIEAVTNFAIDNASAGSITTTGTLTTPALTANELANVTASFTLDGVTVNGTLAITSVDGTIYPTSADILGVSSLDESNNTTYTLQVTFSDASQSIVTVSDWASSNGSAGSIGNTTGVFSGATLTGGNEATNITASYTSEGTTVNDTLSLTVNDTTIYPVSANITGSTSLAEGSSETFVLRVTYTDSSEADVSADSWVSSNVAAGAINNTSGLFQSASNLNSDEVTTLTATYTESGVTVNDMHVLNVTDETVYPVSASIIGSSTINEGDATTFTFQVTYDDTSTANVSVSDWAIDNATAGVIVNNTGVFTAASNNTQSNIVGEISASYMESGVTVSDTHTVGVVDTTVYPVSATITGELSPNEGMDYTYVMNVTFSDASTSAQSVTDFTIDNAATGTIVATTGVLSTANDLSANAAGDITASYTSEGVTVNALLTITVQNNLVLPVSAAVLGVPTLNEGDSATYQLQVTFDDASQSVVSVTDWNSSNTGAATIDLNTGVMVSGELTGGANASTDIAASYTADGVTVNGSRTVTITDYRNLPVSAAIIGSASLSDNAVVETFVLRVTYDDSSTADVVASDWASDNTSAATIVSTTGELTTNDIVGNQTANLSASFTEHSVTVTGNLALTVNDTVDNPVSAVILGSTTVAEEEVESYTFQVTRTSGTQTLETVSDWAIDSAAAGVIVSGTGVLTAATVSANESATISASFTESGITVNGSLGILVTDGAPVVLPLARYGYAAWAGAALDQVAGSADSSAFLTNIVTNLMPTNADGEQLVADTSFQDDVTLYVYYAWPKDLGDIAITNENLSSPEGWPYAQETSAYATDGPSTPIEVTYDDGSGARQWYVRRNDWPGAYDSVTTTYSFDYANN